MVQMSIVRTLLSCVAAVALLSLAAPVSSLAFSSPTWVPRPGEPSTLVLLLQTEKHKKVRSCNKGDDRKNRSNAAVDAWAVACEFPPRSEPNWVSSLQTTTASAIVAGG